MVNSRDFNMIRKYINDTFFYSDIDVHNIYYVTRLCLTWPNHTRC